MKILKNEYLSKYSPINIGGKTKCLCLVNNLKDLRDAIKLSVSLKLQYKILGSGTNVLINSKGINAVIIKLVGDFKNIKIYKKSVWVNSGVSLQNVIKKCMEKGFANLEKFAGIPGTVGGAVFGNVGTKAESISYYITDVWVITKKGNIKKYKTKDIKFFYRKSHFKLGEIIYKVRFKFKQGDKQELKSIYNNVLKNKKLTQDYENKSLGCTFKNVEGKTPVGKLISDCGCKNMSCSNVSVSKKHGNFIICKEGSMSSDYITLIKRIKKRIKEKYKINLELEINLWGDHE